MSQNKLRFSNVFRKKFNLILHVLVYVVIKIVFY